MSGYLYNGGMFRFFSTFLVASLVLTGCASPVTPAPRPSPPSAHTAAPTATHLPTNTPAPRATPGISPLAAAYLDEFFTILQSHSLHRNHTAWGELRTLAFERETAARTTADTYDTLDLVLWMLKDNHSAFLTPQQVADFETMTAPLNPEPEGVVTTDRLAYLFIGSYASLNPQTWEDHARKIQALIARLAEQQPCGWVVDLRQNGGGDFWPMLAGLAPLIGEGEVGAFVDPEGRAVTWRVQADSVFEGGERLVQTGNLELRFLPTATPVAVLLSPFTTSSGEAVVVAFTGRENTRTFGTPTAGLTTANAFFPLSDGAAILLTTSTYADRTGRLYGGALIPDELLAEPLPYAQTIPPEVKAWLLGQPGCSP